MRKISKISFYLATAVILAAIFLHWKLPKNKIADSKKPIEFATPAEKNSSPTEGKIEISSQEINTAPKIDEPSSTLPEKYLLAIPFYSQAPLSKWDTFHEEMCEEASVLNAGLYLENKKLTKDQFEAELQKMKKMEEKELGVWKSTTVSQIKKVADLYFEGKIKSKILDNPTIEQIESQVVAGNPVTVPLSGRDIGNPNFTPPGPVYHMLVVKGFDSQNFITNDVGTRKGDSYTYKKDVIMKNIHDWNEKDIHLGASRVLVLYK